MSSFRSIVVAASAASLLALPMAASAESSGPAASAQAAHRYATTVRFLDFSHTKGFGDSLTIRGQVAVPSLGGAVQGVRVKLYRKLHGGSWHYLATKYTSHQVHPRFTFPTVAIGNADYRVVYAGSKHLKRSSRTTAEAVYRHVTGAVNKRKALLHGRISPHYGHHKVYLDRRPCANCGWHRYKAGHTTGHGNYAFKLTAPAHGAYYWRISTPPSSLFIISHSGVFATRR